MACLSDAEKDAKRTAAERMDLVHEAAREDCVEGCNGGWMQCAKELLRLNQLHPAVFGQAVKDLLMHGRSKYRNLMIYGQSNCGRHLY